MRSRGTAKGETGYTRRMKRILNAVVLTAIIISALVGAYLYASRVPELAATGRLEDLIGLPPMKCEFITSGFHVAMSGTFYLLNGMLRSNYHYAEGRVIRLNAIIRPDATYAWEEGSISGYYSMRGTEGSGDAEYTIIDITTLTTSKYTKCTRWWFPDETLFVPPTDVDFTEVAF